MISEQLASLTSQCPMWSNNDVKHKNRKPREPNEKDRRNEYKWGYAALKTFCKTQIPIKNSLEIGMTFKVGSAMSIRASWTILVLFLRF